METVRAEHVPPHVMETMARGLLAAVDRFYRDPENVRRFEEWKAKKEAQHEQ